MRHCRCSMLWNIHIVRTAQHCAGEAGPPRPPGWTQKFDALVAAFDAATRSPRNYVNENNACWWASAIWVAFSGAAALGMRRFEPVGLCSAVLKDCSAQPGSPGELACQLLDAFAAAMLACASGCANCVYFS